MWTRCSVRRCALRPWNQAFLSSFATAAKRQALLRVPRGDLDEVAEAVVGNSDLSSEDIGRILGRNCAVLTSARAWHLAAPSRVLQLLTIFDGSDIPVDVGITSAMLPALAGMVPLLTSAEVARSVRLLHRLRVSLPAPLLLSVLSVLSVPSSLEVWLYPSSSNDGTAISATSILEGLQTLYVITTHSRAAFSREAGLGRYTDVVCGFVAFALVQVEPELISATLRSRGDRDSRELTAALEAGLLCLCISRKLMQENGACIAPDSVEVCAGVQRVILGLLGGGDVDPLDSSLCSVALSLPWLIRVLNSIRFWEPVHRPLVVSLCAVQISSLLDEARNRRDSLLKAPSAGALLRLLAAAKRAEQVAARSFPVNEAVARSLERVGGRTTTYTYSGLLRHILSSLKSSNPRVHRASMEALLIGLHALCDASAASRGALCFLTWDALRAESAILLHTRLIAVVLGDVPDSFVVQLLGLLASQPSIKTASSSETITSDVVTRWLVSRSKLLDACLAAVLVALERRPLREDGVLGLENTALVSLFTRDIESRDEAAPSVTAAVRRAAATRFEELAVSRAATDLACVVPNCCWPLHRDDAADGVALKRQPRSMTVEDLRQWLC